MSLRQQTRSIFLISIIMIAIILLAGSFSDFQLNEGLPFPSGSGSISAQSPVSGKAATNALDLSFLQGIIGLLVLIGLILFIVNIFIKTKIKQLFIIFSAIAVLVVVLLLLPPFEPASITSAIYETESFVSVPPPIFNTVPLGPPPSALIWVAVFLLFCLLAALGTWWWQSRQKQKEGNIQLTGELKKTITALDAGENFNNAIIACYAGMVRALHQEAGIDRNAAMTPFEFENALMNYGLPHEAVQKLTRLFENARYSQHQSGEAEKINARLFLNEIIAYLQFSAGRKV